jgi:hypothetical protein
MAFYAGLLTVRLANARACYEITDRHFAWKRRAKIRVGTAVQYLLDRAIPAKNAPAVLRPASTTSRQGA